MVLFITIPSEGAIEQRGGQLISIAAGDHHILNAENCPGFYYSTTSGTYYETLELTFAEDGLLTPETQSILPKSLPVQLLFLGRNIRFLRTGCSVRASSVPEAVIFKGETILISGTDVNWFFRA